MARLSGPQRLADAGVRLLYMVAAFAMLWVAQERAADTSYIVNQFGGIPELGLLMTTCATFLAGAMVGLALRPIRPTLSGYRWEVAVALALPPGLWIFAFFAFFFRVWLPPPWLHDFVFSHLSLTFPSLLMGLAVMAGFIAREPVEPD